jgi:hypothetical protein
MLLFSRLLAAASVAVFFFSVGVWSSLYDPHVPTKGSFFEGWYTRVMSGDGKYSFAVIFGLTQLVNKPSEFPRAMVTIAYQDNTDPTKASMTEFRGYPDPTTIKITSNGLPITTNPDFKSPSNFRWDAGDFGYYETTGNSTVMNFKIGDVSFHAETNSITPWSSDGSGFGPAGPLDSLPIPLHWFVYSLGSNVVTYSFINGNNQVAGLGGAAHMEKNWGDAFPAKWIWAEAKDGDNGIVATNGIAFAFSGGDLSMNGVTIPIELSHLGGYRNPSKQLEWNFTPADSRLNKTIDACNGSFDFDLYHNILPRRLSVKMTAPISSIHTCILGPASDGFKGMSTESFLTTIEITAYKHFPYGQDQVLDHVVLQNAGLEFGGDFRCKNPDPCQ